MKDLEIRGAGNLLGGEQSGHIAGVGFDLYVRLVGEAVADFRGDGQPPRRSRDVKVDLPVDAHLPHDYIPGERLRLEAYRKLAAVHDRDEAVEAVRAELIDRYGPLPEPVANLLAVARFRAFARRYGRDRGVAAGPVRPVLAAGAAGVAADAAAPAVPGAVYKAAVSTISVPAAGQAGAAAAGRAAAGVGPVGAGRRARRACPVAAAPRRAAARESLAGVTDARRLAPVPALVSAPAAPRAPPWPPLRRHARGAACSPAAASCAPAPPRSSATSGSPTTSCRRSSTSRWPRRASGRAWPATTGATSARTGGRCSMVEVSGCSPRTAPRRLGITGRRDRGRRAVQVGRGAVRRRQASSPPELAAKRRCRRRSTATSCAPR